MLVAARGNIMKLTNIDEPRTAINKMTENLVTLIEPGKQTSTSSSLLVQQRTVRKSIQPVVLTSSRFRGMSDDLRSILKVEAVIENTTM